MLLVNTCSACHKENSKEAKFCRECGAPLEQSEPESPKKPLTKKQKIIFGLGAAVGILLFGGYTIGKQVYSYENQVGEMMKVLASADASEYVDIMITYDPNFEITEESIAPYAAYLEKNKSYLNEVIMNLRNNDGGPMREIYVEQNGKKILFFDNYSLLIYPVYFSVSTNEPYAKIVVNGTDEFTTDENNLSFEVGPYAPGEQVITADVEMNGYEFNNSVMQDLLASAPFSDVYVPLEGVEFAVYTNQDYADVYLDGKVIGQVENGYGTFGPVSWNAESILELGIDYDFGTYKSESHQLRDYNADYVMNFANVFTYENVSRQVFRPLFRTITTLSKNKNSDLALDKLDMAPYLVNGEENELMTRFTEYIRVFRENEDTSQLDFTFEITDIIQIDNNLYTVKMDMDLTTYYSYKSNRENLKEKLQYEFIIESEHDEPYDGLRFKLKEITSKVDVGSEA